MSNLTLFKIGSERKTCIRVSHWKQQHNMWLARIGPESLTKINRICPNQLTPRHKLLKVWMTYQIKVCFALFLREKKIVGERHVESRWRTCGEPGEEVIGGLSPFLIDASLDDREGVGGGRSLSFRTFILKYWKKVKD